jgi:hypothetical protein
MEDREESTARFLNPEQVHSRNEVLSRPCPVPDSAGVYGWWFRRLPVPMDVSRCQTRGDLILLYTGISPKRPPANGRPPSNETIRSRIKTHYTGNAGGSTLRKTLGCLLAEELGLELRRVGSGKKATFVHGEQTLSDWMAEYALVAWVTDPEPWILEDHLIATLDVPLNLAGNARNQFHRELTRIRAAAVERARTLPIVSNPSER